METTTRITLETHPIGTTRVYKDNQRRIYAVLRTNINGWKLETNAFKNPIFVSVPQGDGHTQEYVHLVGRKSNKSSLPDTIYLHLIA